MENTERIVIAYEGNTVETMDWANGIWLYKEKLKKGKKKAVKSLSAEIQSQFVAGGMLTVFLLLFCYFFPAPPAVILVFYIGVIILHFGLGIFLNKGMNQMKKQYQGNNPGGELILDSVGIEDRNASGTTASIGWSEYEFCVITNQVITMLMGKKLCAIPYTDEACGQLVQALDLLGKTDTVVDCRTA